jgi:hypothetical protein
MGKMTNELKTLHRFTYATLVITDSDNFHEHSPCDPSSLKSGPFNGPIRKV